MSGTPIERESESRRQRARRLALISWSILRSDRRLLIFPAISAIVNLMLGGVAFGLAVHWIGRSRGTILAATIIGAYPIAFVSFFCGVALAAMLDARANGQPAEPAHGWAVARSRLPVIVGWTLLTCTVGAVLRVLEERVPLGGKIAAYLADLTWSLATLFAVPVLAYENLGPVATLRRSKSLFRQRWAEGVSGQVAIGLGAWVVALPCVALLLAGLAAGGAAGLILVACGGAGLVAIASVDTALAQTYQVFLYRSTLALDGPEADPFTGISPWQSTPGLFSDTPTNLPDEASLKRMLRQRRERRSQQPDR